MARSLRRMAGWLADSLWMSRGRRLFARNAQDFNLPLSKLDKLWAGVYIIVEDYSTGRFPPRFDDMRSAHQAEADYYEHLPGQSLNESLLVHLRKPFWGAAGYRKYSRQFERLLAVLEGLELKPPARLLELGCGPGWMAEFLAQSGYNVVGTTIAPLDVDLAERRAAACRSKGLAEELRFHVCPMENVDSCVDAASFDAAFVFEALHHAYDWRRAVDAAARCLKPHGYLIIANEPNWLHTFVSYRVARLTNTHEIGFTRGALLAQLRASGLRAARVIAPRIDNLASSHWIAAQK